MPVSETQRRPGKPRTSPAVVAVPAGWAASAGVDVRTVLGAAVRAREYRETDLGREEQWADVVALIPGDLYVGEAVLDAVPDLRLISIDGTGFDQVDVKLATRRGVTVCNVRDYAADAVAEFTFGLLLALQRRIIRAQASVRDGRWTPDEFVGTTLRGRRLGLVGLGSIGARVADLGRAFGMEVVCATAHPERAREGVTTPPSFVSLTELLSTSDVISLHVALSDETRGLLGPAQFRLLREGAVLINTSRGGLVDHPALLEALRSGRLAGAALDVTDPEPIPKESPLLAMDNVIVTPHIAAATDDARRAAVVGCLDHVRDFFDGRPRSVVNVEVVPQP